MVIANPKNKTWTVAFFLLVLLLGFDYIRPQGELAFLKPLRIPMLLILILSYLGFRQGRWKFNDASTKAFLVLVLVSVAYVPFAINNFWAYQMARALCIYFLQYMAIKSFIDTEKKMSVFLNCWLIIGVICSVKGILNGGKIPGSGFLGDENDFALYLAMMIPIAYFGLFKKNSIKIKFLYFLSIGLLVTGIISSFSRGGLVGLIGVAFFCWLMTPKKVLILTVCVIVALTGFSLVSTKYKADMATIAQGAEESTGGERLYSWKCGLKMFYDNPIFGVGPGNFPWRFAEYEPPEKWKGRSHGGRAAHSLYFTLLPELGLVGVICYFIMIYAPYKEFKSKQSYIDFKKLQPDDLSILKGLKSLLFSIYGILFGFLLAGIFLSVLYYPHFWIVCGLLGSSKNIFLNQNKQIQHSLMSHRTF